MLRGGPNEKLSLLLFGIVSPLLPLFSSAATYTIVTREIQLHGYNLSANSYDSSDPLWSTANGQYDPLKGGRDGVLIASEAGILNANNIGVVDIWGRLETSSTYSLEISDQSVIGSAAWHSPLQTGIEPGAHTTNSLPMLPDVEAPPPGFTPVAGVVNGESYDYILFSGSYTLPSLVMSGGQRMLVIGDNRLDVKGQVHLSGNASIRILPTASLRLFLGGKANIRGAGIINEGVSRNLAIFGTPGHLDLNLRLTTPFVGSVYAPRATCTIDSTGNGPADFQGSLISRSLHLGSHVDWHVDVAP